MSCASSVPPLHPGILAIATCPEQRPCSLLALGGLLNRATAHQRVRPHMNRNDTPLYVCCCKCQKSHTGLYSAAPLSAWIPCDATTNKSSDSTVGGVVCLPHTPRWGSRHEMSYKQRPPFPPSRSYEVNVEDEIPLLRIHVVSARGLPRSAGAVGLARARGMPDPYVVVKFNGEKVNLLPCNPCEHPSRRGGDCHAC